MISAAAQARHLTLARAEAAAGAAFGHSPDDVSVARWPVALLGAALAILSAGAAVAGTLVYAL